MGVPPVPVPDERPKGSNAFVSLLLAPLGPSSLGPTRDTSNLCATWGGGGWGGGVVNCDTWQKIQ